MANTDRLERVTVQLDRARDELSQTREKLMQHVQQSAQKDMQYAHQMAQQEILNNGLRNQLLGFEVRFENLQREYEDYRSQHEVRTFCPVRIS